MCFVLYFSSFDTFHIQHAKILKYREQIVELRIFNGIFHFFLSCQQAFPPF